MKNKILAGVILINMAVVAAIGQFPPIPLRLYSSDITDPNVIIADINRDGKVTPPDWFLYANAYQNARGTLPSIKPDDLSMLRMEIALKDQAIAALENQLEQERFDRNKFKNWFWQLNVKDRELTKAAVLDLFSELNAPVTVTVGRVAVVELTTNKVHIMLTFDDPNGVK